MKFKLDTETPELEKSSNYSHDLTWYNVFSSLQPWDFHFKIMRREVDAKKFDWRKLPEKPQFDGVFPRERACISENIEQQSCKCQQGQIPLEIYTKRRSRFSFNSELNSKAANLDLWCEVFFQRQIPLEN